MAHQIILKDSVLADLRQICLGVYDAGQKLTVEELLEKMMDHPEVPIHYPYHHFIMPAALLTLAAMEQSEPREALEEMLDTAKTRSLQVPAESAETSAHAEQVSGQIFYECLDPDNAGFRKDLAVVQ